MQRYNCKVRHGGSVHNEIQKPGVSAAEIIVLRTLHGSDAVVGISPTTNDRTEHRVERDHLDRRYGPALSKLQPAQSVSSLFGPPHVKLPGKLDDFDGAEPEADEETEEKAA